MSDAPAFGRIFLLIHGRRAALRGLDTSETRSNDRLRKKSDFSDPVTIAV